MNPRSIFPILPVLLLALSCETVLAQQPQILSGNQPQSKSVGIGQSVTFNVQAQGGLPLFFQWKRNGVNIPGATSSSTTLPATASYSIQSAQPTNTGSYDVVVYNSFGAIDSSNAVLLITNVTVLAFGDNFANRGNLTFSAQGTGRGNNVSATGESGEPRHGGKPGGASVWLKWSLPAGNNIGGIATFDTRGSSFDTTLAVYTGTLATGLTLVAGDDDGADYLNSSVTFNARTNTEYEIAIDGFYAARGNIALNWVIESTTDRLPEFLVQPVGKTLALNSFYDLFVQASSNTPPTVTYQWQFNGVDVQGANKTSFTAGPLKLSSVGRYNVKLILDQGGKMRTNTSDAAELQVNMTDGTSPNPNVAAQPKFREAADSTYPPGLPFRGNGGIGAAPAGGFTGTQIFNTTNAVKEPDEPNHCGEPGGASYWFSYLAPANGTLSVDTAGTTFNNVLAIYTGPDPITAYSDLVSVTCSSTNSGADGESVAFGVASGSVYYIVSDGVGGVTGVVQLNYNLNAAPTITNQPASKTVLAGANTNLTVGVTGSPTLKYQWRFNTTNIASATTSSLAITGAHATNAGSYTVVITNSTGSVTSSPATLTVNGTPFITVQPTNQTVVISNNATFIIAAIGSPTPKYQWRFNATNNLAGATNSTFTVTTALAANAGSYTALATNSFGGVTSSIATLTVNFAPAITTQPLTQTVPQGSNVTLTVGATGSPTPGYQWRFNGVNAAGRTSSSETVTNFQAAKEGAYDALVTNIIGSVTSSAAYLFLNSPLRFTNILRASNNYSVTLLGAAGTNYIIDVATNLNGWTPVITNTATNGIINFGETNVLPRGNRLFRAHSQ